MLGANSRIKGEKDWAKYEKARLLKKYINKIREDYEVHIYGTMLALHFTASFNFLIIFIILVQNILLILPFLTEKMSKRGSLA